MPTLRLRALNGDSVSLSGPQVPDGPARCTTVALFNLGGQLQQFTAGDANFARLMGESLGVTEDATYRVQSGTLRVSSGRNVSPEGVVDPFTHVAWEGASHSLGYVVYSTDTRAALAPFEATRIEEHPDGVVLTSADPRAVLVHDTQHAPSTIVPAGKGNLLEVFQLTRYWRRQRPRWRGRLTAGGELYAEQATGDPTMLLYGPTSVARIYFGDKRSAFAAQAADLSAGWE